MYDYSVDEWAEIILHKFIFSVFTIVFIVLIALFIKIPMRWYFKSVLGDNSKKEEADSNNTKEGGS